MDNTLHIKQDLGAPMSVVVTDMANRANKRHDPGCATGSKLIEFYDGRYAKEPGFSQHGQYIGCYCVADFNQYVGRDLIINSNVPQWFVHAANVQKIADWLNTFNQ